MIEILDVEKSTFSDPLTGPDVSPLPDALVRVISSEVTVFVNQIAGLAHEYRSLLSALGSYPTNIDDYAQTNPQLLKSFGSIKGKIELFEKVLGLLGQKDLVERLKTEVNSTAVIPQNP